MNIRSIQSNLNKMHDDNIIKFLYDIVIQNLPYVKSYESGINYSVDDLIYIQEEGIHKIYQCIVNLDNSPVEFLDCIENWEYVLDVYTKDKYKISNLKIKEEVHIITEDTVNGIVTNLDFKSENSSFVIYKGKNRYAFGYDFTVDGKNIFFNSAFNIGDKIILEIRESIGLPDKLVLLSSNGLRYEISVMENDLYIFESDNRTSVNEVFIKDSSNNRKYKVYMDNEDIYYELTDINVSKTEIKVLDVDGNEHILQIVDDELVVTINKEV